LALENGADLLIIYYGHNEVSQFVQLERFSSLDPDAIAARIALNRSAMGRLLQRIFHRPADGSLSGAGEAIFSAQPPQRDAVERLKALAVHNLRWNLSTLLDAAGSRGVPVILCQVATNYRFTHLNAFEDPGPGDQNDIDRLVAEAEAYSLDGQHEEARARYQLAIDRSASPREASSSIRGAIADLADIHDVTHIDVHSALYRGSPDGLSVSGLFWDDLHPTVKGHAEIARILEAPVLRLIQPD
jgi:lysophospholipase L1-like esterase